MNVSLSLLALLLANVQDDPYSPHVEPASSEGRETIATFEVPPGFEVTQWAAEPMLANPVCLYVDDSGEIYVAETFRHHAGVTDIREHMDWLDDDLAATSVEERAAYFEKHEGEGYALYSEHHERIRLIRDTDGDGIADEAVVFADGFNDPMAGIGAGLLSRAAPTEEHPDRREVLYTCIPDLWRLVDTDGDGIADERQQLHTGFGVHVALLGHDLHGLRIGPDGRVYFSSGDRGFKVQLEDGRVLQHDHTGAVLRCELDGSNLEVFATGLRNPQELVFDQYGNLWTGDNNSDGGDEARWVYVVEGMDAGWRYSYQWITWPNLRGPWNDEQLWHPHHEGQAAYIVPPVANLASGPSGLAYNPGTGLPPEYDEHFFLCDFRGAPSYSGIWAFDVVPKGAGFELGEAEWFFKNTLCTDADFGPDGALYVTDWVEGWNQTGKGRVYRVAHPESADSSVVTRTKRLLGNGIGAFEGEELLALLDHPDVRVRQQAHLRLSTMSPWAQPNLLEIAFDDTRSQKSRIHAIWGMWALMRRDWGGKWDLSPLLSDGDPEIRAQVARVLGETRTESPEVLVGLLSDESPRVRSLAAIALGRAWSGYETLPVLRMLEECPADDPVLRHAGVMALVRSERGSLSQEVNHPFRQVRLAAVVAMRRSDGLIDGEWEVALGSSDPAVVLEAARAIYDLPVDQEMPRLAALIGRFDVEDYPLQRRALNANFRLGKEHHARALAEFALRGDVGEEIREEALHLLMHWTEPPGRDFVTGAWRPLEPRATPWLPGLVAELVLRGIDEAPPGVMKKWIELASAVAPEEHASRFVDWALDPSVPVSIRSAALRALSGDVTPALVERLRTALFVPEPAVRAAALTAFRRLAPDEALPVLESALARGTLLERRAAYTGLGQLPGDRPEALLADELAKLAREEVAAELALDLVLAAEARESPALDALIALRAQHRADPKLAPWLDALHGGDPANGEAIFLERSELSCLRCHKIDDERGGEVGPDLRGLSARASRLDMLTSILDPNRLVTTGFESESFFLLDGTVIVGRVLSETSELVSVIDSEAEVWDFTPDEIEVRRAALSAMPEGQEQFLSRAEMRDLIAWLAGL